MSSCHSRENYLVRNVILGIVDRNSRSSTHILEYFLLFHQEEQRYKQRKRTLLILILHHLCEEG